MENDGPRGEQFPEWLNKQFLTVLWEDPNIVQNTHFLTVMVLSNVCSGCHDVQKLGLFFMDWEYAEFWDRFSSVLEALVVPI